MDCLVVGNISSLSGIRAARQAYSALPWEHIGRVEQRQALAGCIPNHAQIDFDYLRRLGMWQNVPTEQPHVMVSCVNHRRAHPDLHPQIYSSPLPSGALMRIEPNLYSASPAFAALQYARGRSLPQVLMLLLELIGTYSLPGEATFPIAWGGRWPDSIDDCEVEQAHYHCEAVLAPKELRAMAKQATSSSDAVFRAAARLAIPGAASPMEALLYAMLASGKHYGGFGCASLPRGGLLLNHRIDFTEEAQRISSGVPYAVCDVYCPAARSCVEYNGGYHESAAARIHDGNRNNGLRAMGIQVIIINREQMRDVAALEEVAKMLYQAAGVRFRYTFDGYRERQISLLNGLRQAIGLPPA